MRRAWMSVAILLAAASPAPAGKLDLPSVRAATSKYADAAAARADGYVDLPGAACLTAAALGAAPSSGNLGKLLIHRDRLLPYAIDGRLHIDRVWTNWVDPGVLIYEPAAGGGDRLAGIANIVAPRQLAWEGYTAPPATRGLSWSFVEDDPSTAADEAYGLEPHYTLRLWLFRDNPEGLSADLNPMVSCNDTPATGLN